MCHSEVHAARCLTNGRTIAAKLIDLEKHTFDIDKLRKLMAFWSTCQHRNVIDYYGSFISDSTLWCIMEYVDGGSVADILHFGYPDGFGDEYVVATVLQEVLQFLIYLHGRRQMHRAICTNNVLLTTRGEVKIGNFGSATELIRAGHRVRATFTVIDSPYSAPEVMIEGNGYGPAADIWSVGILAYTMATGHGPHDSLPPLAKVQEIIEGPSPELPTDVRSHSLRDFVRQCLQRDPAKRPTAVGLAKHVLLKKAMGADFLRTELLAKLPPLSQRFEAMMNRKDAANGLIAAAFQKKVPPGVSFDFTLDGTGEAVATPPEPQKPEVSETIQGRFRVSRSALSPQNPSPGARLVQQTPTHMITANSTPSSQTMGLAVLAVGADPPGDHESA
jgi:serine/threonine-protein kinase OSR1/STK39